MSVNGLLATLRWSISIGRKFVRVVPGATLTVVLSTLIAQIALLLAFFLPLKVIILLGSTGIPRYFPPSFAEVDRDFLVITLSIGAVAAYLLYLLADRVIHFGADYGARRLLAHGRKMILFENQDEIATTGYQRYSRTLANVVFVLLAFGVLAVIYPSLMLLAAGYSACVFVALLVVYGVSQRFRAGLDTLLKPTVTIAGAVGFLIGFAYLVTDFLLWSPPGLIVAIISLLLMRQLFSHASASVNGIRVLYEQRLKLNALFFHRQVMLPEQGRPEQGIWHLMTAGFRQDWLQAVLSELTGSTPTRLSTRWHQTGVSNVAALEVFPGMDPETDAGYLVKLFDESRSSQALHEATLLAELPAAAGLPVPEFLGATRVGRFQCHVFAWPSLNKVSKGSVGASALEVMGKLLALEPPAALVHRYRRSHPFLWQRINETMTSRLRLAADDKAQQALIEQFEKLLDVIRNTLQALPLVIVNRDIKADTLLIDVDGNPLISHWGRWALEPAGVDWSVEPRHLAKLDKALAQSAGERAALADVSPAQIRLSAMMHTLERFHLRQQYVHALALLPRIIQTLDEIPTESYPGASIAP